ncbi:DUF1661 domain-containing protein [Porphyromonas gingivalis]|uniref:DUF1661 domain-containing protein n=1 Tax=Porphyromonas gingivalis TaxID=837 RepID=UPI00352BC1FD
MLRATTEKFSLANFRKHELLSGKIWAVRKFEIKSSLLCHYCSIKVSLRRGKQPNHTPVRSKRTYHKNNK